MGKKRTIKPWMSLFGLLGLLGFTSFPLQELAYLAFFSFFGFFSWYWEGKLAADPPDERLTENRLKASRTAFSLGFAAVFVSMVLIGNIWSSTEPGKAYALLTAVVSISFAVSINLNAWLTYKYDQSE